MHRKLAICLRCGSEKRSAGQRCPNCGYSPKGDTDAEIRSLMLSTKFLFPPGSDPESPRSRAEYRHIFENKIAELERQAVVIKSGKPPEFDERLVRRMVQQHVAARNSMKRHWFSTSLFFLILAIPFLLALFGFLVLFLTRHANR